MSQIITLCSLAAGIDIDEAFSIVRHLAPATSVEHIRLLRENIKKPKLHKWSMKERPRHFATTDALEKYSKKRKVGNPNQERKYISNPYWDMMSLSWDIMSFALGHEMFLI